MTTRSVPHPARTIADHILYLRSRHNLATTPLEINKLVYISHGWMLGIHRRSLSEEPAEAWTYGPVIPEVYHTYKSFGRSSIDTNPKDMAHRFDQNQIMLMEEVVVKYKKYKGLQLSSITHMKGTPWYQVYRGGKGLGSIIPNKIIEQYYYNLSIIKNR